MHRAVWGIILVLCSLQAAPHRLRVYPNASIRAFAIAQGPDGLLWLAAADGLYRFDGFHYQKITAYPLSSARYIAFTGDGSLWVADFQGLVRMRDGHFEKILEQDIHGLAAYRDQVFVQTAGGLTQVGLDGSVRRMSYRLRREMSIDSSGRLWGVCLDPVQICWIDPKNPEQKHPAGAARNYYQVSLDAQGRVWMADSEHAALFENGRLDPQLERRSTTEGNRPGPLLGGGNGHLWFVGETPRELASNLEFRDRADHARFAPLAGLEDAAGHLWISSSERGLIEWIPDEHWERWFPEDLSGEPAVQFARDRNGALFLATHKHIYRKDGAHWRRVTRDERRYESFIPLDDGEFFASIRDFGFVRLSKDGAIVERLPDAQPGRNQYREIVRDKRGRYWVAAKEALLRIEGSRGSLRLVPQSLPAIPPEEMQQAVDLEIDQAGRLWVGYDAGLAWLDDEDRWHRIETSQPATFVRSISAGADRIFVAYRRPGLFSRLVRNGERWDVTQFPHGPRDTYFIKHDSRGWIWRGTPSGVYVSDGTHFAEEDWLHLHMGNGLAADELDQYGFFEDTDGSIWIAGEEGVTHVRPDASWFEAPRDASPPRVTGVEADGQSLLHLAGPPRELPRNLKTLRIELGTLSASRFRDFPLRWRLLPSKDWHASSNATFEFRNPVNGEHSLEVAYAGGQPFAVYSFRIGTTPSLISWLWLFVPAGLAAPFALRKSALAKARFRIEKSLFVMRRRFHRSAADSVPNDWSGAVLNGRYRARKIVSRGGFSIVYEADDLQAPRSRIAVKVLNRTMKKDGWVRDRFAHEVSALRSIEHPGVVRVLDSWISPQGEPCLAMPFLEGGTLRQALSRFDRGHAAALIRRIGDALAEVHARGIVHRDLKPENIILMEDDQPVVVDFGSAGVRSAENEMAETTLLAGSFHYMAPERLTGRYSPATDTYSFAVIILELLGGKRLADLRASFSDASFVDELAEILGNERAAALLAPAFDPDPRRRPASVKHWSEQIAAAIDQA